MVEVRSNNMLIGNDIICIIKGGKVIGGCRSAAFGFDMPDCYRLCSERVLNGIFVNRE